MTGGIKMEQIEKLSNGALIKLRPVPPFVLGDVYATLPPPPSPKMEMHSRAGSETAMPLPGSTEYEDYRQAMADHRVMMQRAAINFTLQYGVIAWKWPDEEWTDEPPEDWTVPPIMAKLSLSAGERKFSDRRLQYIKYALVLTPSDMELVDAIINGQTAPVTEREVQAASVPFVSQIQEDSQ